MRYFFLVALLCTTLCAPVQADISWNVVYDDGASAIGFGTANAEGATRRATFEAALGYISSVLDTPNDVTLDYTVNASQTDGTGFLAQAGTSFFLNNGFTNGVLFEHAQTGIDPSGGVDGSARFDFGYNWNSEVDTPTGGEYDLFTVALHEVTHSLGFLSLMQSNGDSSFGGNPGTYSVLNSFLELGDGTALFAAGGNFIGTAADLISDDLFFNGANATAANGGNRVKTYAPVMFASGSSLSHVDTDTYPLAVMTAAVASGIEKKTYSAIDLGILQDIGWNINAFAVPEPGSMTLFAMGVSTLLFRRRR